jgi:hypothetical protein
MEKLSNEGYKLSTGKMFYPYCAYVFISEIKEGDGGNIGEYMYEVSYKHNDADDLTKVETLEVAEYMAKIWTEFANSLK